MTNRLGIFLSILLGLGIALIFKLCCDSRSCMMYRSTSVDQKMIRYQDKCYLPSERAESCDAKKTRVDVNE
jgi:hypothetical protein